MQGVVGKGKIQRFRIHPPSQNAKNRNPFTARGKRPNISETSAKHQQFLGLRSAGGSSASSTTATEQFYQHGTPPRLWKHRHRHLAFQLSDGSLIGAARMLSKLFSCCGCCSLAPDEATDDDIIEDGVCLSANAQTAGVTLDGTHGVRGVGQVLADQCVLQDRSYWEVCLVSDVPDASAISVGVVAPSHALGEALSEDGANGSSWCLNSKSLQQALQPEDVIGCAMDQSDYPVKLSFFLNGTLVREIRGPVAEATPILSLEGAAPGVAVTANFGQKRFSYKPAHLSGFDGLLRSRSLI